MQNYKTRVEETAGHLRAGLAKPPVIGLLTGTGLGESAAAMDVSAAFDYRDLPHFPVSTVESHPGRLLFGTLGKWPTVVMQGRFHLYEGYSPLEVVYPIRVLQALGVKVLIVTNAAGGLNADFRPGDLMVISDHINLTGANPLIGPNIESWGIRFPDMGRAYDPQLARLTRTAATSCGLDLREGVYAGLLGPSLETPAEIRFLTTIGADAVGLSTIQEVIAAVHGGMRVLGLSIITNLNAPDHPQPASVEAIIEVARRTAPALETLIRKIGETLDVTTLC